MMEATLPRSLKEQFTLTAAMREEEISYREKMARFAARQRQMTAEQEIAAKRKEAEAQAFLEHALAPPARIAEFRVKLDSYDTKTVEALMENQEAIEAVRRKLDEMLDKAHVLPDGRRVFKTQDGARVFDEQGQAVAEDLIRPDMIPDGKPKWEAYKVERDEERKLARERSELIDYQAKLDAARDRIDRDGLTETELSRIEDDLRKSMPEAVRAKVEPDKPKVDAAPTPPSAPSMPDGMDALMRQTGLGPSFTAGPR